MPSFGMCGGKQKASSLDCCSCHSAVALVAAVDVALCSCICSRGVILSEAKDPGGFSPSLDGVPLLSQVAECQVHHFRGCIFTRNAPRILIALRRLMFSDSMALLKSLSHAAPSSPTSKLDLAVAPPSTLAKFPLKPPYTPSPSYPSSIPKTPEPASSPRPSAPHASIP